MQVLLFGLIPFIWWKRYGTAKFSNWIGLIKVPKENLKKVIIKSFVILVLYCSLTFYLLTIVENNALNQFSGLGFSGLFTVVIYSFIQTSFTEEILFRGFLLKRLKNKFGLISANTIQSLLFGLLHGIMFFSSVNVITVILITLFTGGVSFFMGYINEVDSDGSILPSWLIHGFSNLFASIIILFNII